MARRSWRVGGPGTVMALVVLVGCSVAGRLDDATVAANNRGVALMGRFDYAAAHDVFAALVDSHPRQPALLVNLAIATLNRQQPGDEEAALDLTGRALAADPDNLRASYVAGIVRLYLGDARAALVDFSRVTAAGPDDPDAAYFEGRCLAQLGRQDEAYAAFRRALGLDPGLRSALYQAFQTAQRLGRETEAEELLQRFQQLEGNPRARLTELKYTRMGAKAMAVTLGEAPPQPVPAGPTFGAPRRGPRLHVTGPAAVIAGDLDGDGRPDALVSSEAGLLPLLATDGGFVPTPEHPLTGGGAVHGVLLGDIDNDGLVDAYLLRHGPNRLLCQVTPGEWRDVTASTATDGGDRDTVDGAMVDADHDGDLDLFLVSADGPDELLNNDLDGGFRPLAAARGLDGGERPSRQVLLADLDGDRDLDLVVLHDRPPHAVWRNELLWSYSALPGMDAFVAAPAAAVVSLDGDADGRPELVTVAPEGSLTRWVADAGAWRAEAWPTRLGPGPYRLAAADVDGDGGQDLLVSDGDGWRLLDAVSGTERLRTDLPLTGWSLVLSDPAQGPALVGVARDGGLVVWPPGPGRGGFVAVQPSGRDSGAEQMRSNASGLGTRIAVRVGRRWSAETLLRSNSGPGQGLQPAWFGLGGAHRADFAAFDWPDGVYQTELELAAGELHRIAETQRQLSSCPLVFAWDGRRMGFVSDILGVGGMGYAVAPGEYAPPRPWERLLLPPGLPATRNGRLVVAIAEPMEEATYLDRLGLVAWDLPPGWAMVPDERMGIAGPEPTGEPLFYRSEVLPERAHDGRGEDVTATVTAVDRRAAPLGAPDRRFIGRLAAPQVLELEFARPLSELGEQLALVADGWLEYPYSQTNFAAWQAGASYDAPTLEARDGGGRWRVVAAHFGYPAGMPRRMALPLPPLPPGADALRLTTNMEIYWDRLAVVAVEACPAARRHELRLIGAELRELGFPRRTTGPQRRPRYDYDDRTPLWDTRHQAGLYTAFGPVDELLAAADDALAIFGPGEEVRAEFAPPADPPPAGWRRIHVLAADGWCKDMDLYTRHGATLAPIPAAGRGDPARVAALAARFNRRLGGG